MINQIPKRISTKTLAILLSIIMIVSLAITISALPAASAHTPAWQIPTYAFIVAAPNPIGVGQTMVVYFWLDQVFGAGFELNSFAALENSYRFQNYNLTIILPDGKVQTTIFPVVSDPTSSQYTKFTPTEVGNYTLIFTFPGQAYAQYPGDYNPSSVLVNDTYLPSSASTTLTVQQTPIPEAIGSSPLPSEYWTHPIYGLNTDWWTISSNWLGEGSPVNSATGSGVITGFGQAQLQRYPGDAVGPTTSHVMWTKPLEFGGVVGGNNFPTQGVAYFEGSAYNNRFVDPIIMGGYLYYTEPISFTGTPGGLSSAPYGPTDCVDLRTGQLIWSRTDIPALSFGYIYDLYDPNQHGVYPPILFTSNFGEAFDAYTGDWLFNVTGVPSGTAAQGPQGEQLIYNMANAGTAANPDWRLGEWNSSKLWTYNWLLGTSLSPSISGTVDASISNPSNPNDRYDWNVSIPWANTITSPVTELAVFYNNMMLCINGTYPTAVGALQTPSSTPYTYFAVNLNATKGPIGTILWTQAYNPPAGNLTVTFGGADPTVNVFIEGYKETTQWIGYSLTTGQKIWGPTASQTAFDYYGNPVLPYDVSQVAYGKLYSSAFGGILYCYDLTSGKLLWTYGNGGPGNSTNSGFNTPYGDYPTFIQAVGNGIIYLASTEHTITDPIYKGAMARAVNATNGQEIWTLSDYTGEFNYISYAIADGYATWFNGYDDSVYSVGQGPSATTVTAPDLSAAFGQRVVIKGTVMDVSAGTQQTQQKADFPNGVPVSSDASMTAWMGYVYQQQPMPTNFTGVPVTIDVLDSNGNYRNIGTATTTATGSYSFTWTPDIPGSFQVIATFHGNNAYWGSYAQTASDVMQEKATPAPTSVSGSNTATTSDLLMYMSVSVIAIIIAIAIVGLLLYRKHP
jgi:hypothetical protein